MIQKTVIEIVTLAERELHQSAGMSVQVYSQSQLAQNIQHGFNLIFDDTSVRWKKFEQFQTYTLNGTTGYTTTPVSAVFSHYEDIIHVYPDSQTRPLTNWDGSNPAAIVGGLARYVLPGVTDILRVLPASAAGEITVVGKVRPAEFSITDTVPFDYLTLVYFAAWQYMVDDGTNPGSIEKLRQLFEQRYKEMKLQANKEPIQLSDTSSIPLSWRDE